MPYRRKFFGGYEFSGNMKEWMDLFYKWHKEDTAKYNVDFETYFGFLFIWYSGTIREQWRAEGRKNDVIQMHAIEFVGRENLQSKISSGYSSVDYMSERVPISYMLELQYEARGFVIEMLTKYSFLPNNQ